MTLGGPNRPMRVDPNDTHGASGGMRMKYLRKKKGLSLQFVADQIGRSVGFVSQIERGISQPSIQDVYAISQLLGVDYLSFFESPVTSTNDPHIVRLEERSSLNYRGNIKDQLLSPKISGRFHLLLTELEPGAFSSQHDVVENDGEQGGVIVEGQMHLWLNGKLLILEAGDSFQFESTTPHRYENPGPGPTKVFWAVSLK